MQCRVSRFCDVLFYPLLLLLHYKYLSPINSKVGCNLYRGLFHSNLFGRKIGDVIKRVYSLLLTFEYGLGYHIIFVKNVRSQVSLNFS